LTIFDGIMGCRRNGLSEQWAVGIMGRRSNGLSEEWVSEKWAVGIMGCRNYHLTPIYVLYWYRRYQRGNQNPSIEEEQTTQ